MLPLQPALLGVGPVESVAGPPHRDDEDDQEPDERRDGGRGGCDGRSGSDPSPDRAGQDRDQERDQGDGTRQRQSQVPAGLYSTCPTYRGRRR
jgi:hypothetical protein